MFAASEPVWGSVSEKPPSAAPEVRRRAQRARSGSEPKRPIVAATALCIESVNA